MATKGTQESLASNSAHFLNLPTLILNQKANQFYLEFMNDFIPIIEKAYECLKNNRPAPLPVEHLDQTLIQLIWQQCLTRANESAKSLVFYVKKLPGFDELDIFDFAALLAQHTSTLLGIKFNKSFIGGEQFFMIMQNIRINPALTRRLMGDALCENLFGFDKRLKALDLRDSEIALLMPYVMSSPGYI